MPRILFVVDSIAEMGIFGQLGPLIRPLSESNHSVDIVSLSARESKLPDWNSVNWHFFRGKNRTINKWQWLRQRLSKLNPDVIHGWGAQTWLPILLSDLGSGRQRIFSHFAHSESSSYLTDLVLRSLGRQSDVHVLAHDSLLRDLSGAPNHQIITNAICSSASDRQLARDRLLRMVPIQDDGIFLAGTVSSYQPRYRLKDLVWAIDLLCCVRQDVHLIVFGFGDSRPLRRYIGKTVADKNIHLVDIERAEIEMLSGLNFYWNSQREVPNAPAMINCMANGVPVVSVLDQETSDLVLPLQSALATNLGGRDEFARWTKYLIEQPESAIRLAKQGKAHVEKLFATRNMVDSYLKLYSEG